MLKTVEKTLAVPSRLQKVNGWSCSCWLWQPQRLRCDCLSNSCIPVVLNRDSEGCIRPPGTLCAVLSSFSL